MKVGTSRIREIVLSLRNFSRLDEAEKKFANIHEGIDSSLMILHNQIKSKPDFCGIEVIKEYSDLPLVECFPGELNQVFMNILTNAIDALEENTKSHQSKIVSNQLTPPQIRIITKIQEDYVCISIADNGIGMTEEVGNHIFGPSYQRNHNLQIADHPFAGRPNTS
jgi:two-component system, NtrC family, sensor kinase